MKEITKEQEERLLLYATYTILYLNDTACFSIQQLGRWLQDKDKESKKIYMALLKRNKEYLDKMNNVVGRSMEYYCDYCTEMDNICDNAYNEFKNALYETYKACDVQDYEYMAHVETMRSMVELSVEAGKKVISDIKKFLPSVTFLENYLLIDMARVANNFSDWSYRKVPNNVSIDFSDSECDVMKKFRNLSTLLIDYYSFDQSYRKTVELELKRKQDGCN